MKRAVALAQRSRALQILLMVAMSLAVPGMVLAAGGAVCQPHVLAASAPSPTSALMLTSVSPEVTVYEVDPARVDPNDPLVICVDADGVALCDKATS